MAKAVDQSTSSESRSCAVAQNTELEDYEASYMVSSSRRKTSSSDYRSIVQVPKDCPFSSRLDAHPEASSSPSPLTLPSSASAKPSSGTNHKFVPFTGVARRLNEEPVVSADSVPKSLSSSSSYAETPSLSVDAEDSSSQVISASASSNATEESASGLSHISKTEDESAVDGLDQAKFQAFSGKKYMLGVSGRKRKHLLVC